MDQGRWVGFLVLFLVACGSDDGAGPAPGDMELPDAVPTGVGSPDGTLVSATIGAAGGSLTSDDGGLTLEIPAGALAADTELGIQPITNAAWGGLGPAYRLTPDGLDFAAPVELVFSAPAALLAGTAPEFLNVAFQDDQGFWFVPGTSSYDAGAATLTCTTTHFTDFAMIEQYRLVPTTATVAPSGGLNLSVDFCFYRTIAEDEYAIMEVLVCEDSDEELAPLVTFSDWSVNGIPGGSAQVGTVTETATHAAHYTAPAAVPQTNPVAVSVQVDWGAGTAILVCNVTIIAPGWSGPATAWYGQDERADATLTWHTTGVFGDLEFLAATGFVTRTIYSDPGCPQVSLDPDTWLIGGTDGLMIIDHSVDPPAFMWNAATYWDAEYCYDCGPEYEVVCVDYPLSATFGDFSGELSQNGTRIQGYLYDIENEIGYSFDFTRTP